MEDDGELSALWPAGVCVVFIGSWAGALGDTMVRRAYMEAGDDVSSSVMLKRPLFVFGMLLTIVLDPICTFVALLFAPSSIVTPFAGVHIFWAVLIAHFWLKEYMGYWEKCGSVGIVTGVMLMVVFSGKRAKIDSIDSFDSYVRSAGAVAYLVYSSILLIIILVLAFKWYPCSLGRSEFAVGRLATSVASGFLGGNANIATKFFTIIVMDLCTGNTAIFSNWRTYVVALGASTVGLGQLFFLNVALRRYEAVYVVPTINSSLVTQGTIGAILLLHETPGNWIAFGCGLVMCVGGIVVLTAMHTVQASRVEQKTSGRQTAQLDSGVEGWGTAKSGVSSAARSLKSFRTLKRSLTRSATAVAEMSVILNSQAIYSMYTLQEKHPLEDFAEDECDVDSPSLPRRRVFPAAHRSTGRTSSASSRKSSPARRSTRGLSSAEKPKSFHVRIPGLACVETPPGQEP
ncbi:magnesium transporter NIPA [Toxoplasma gondii VAND]|uniref:Magnesium transporter NIPA n=7 Tax=Toxoplasma gondii TaxID=5811 RepID=V4ZCU9_TOXGV|nr:magnesium transporter NIPA [Toxoplasma gondii VEG]KFG46143.1 magnesium transporter NIPA [Toxoplasma gondii p89]KFH07174.1 magnesium transporter NIPA [Toxoplasma gondii VAND]CEL73814.1 TPA: Magnesium transporter NIPA2 [Toxoplasma gondii VEG]